MKKTVYYNAIFRTILSLSFLSLFTAACPLSGASYSYWQFKDWDNDGDEEIVRTEFDLGYTGLYDSWDVNSDNSISEAEYENAVFEVWDKDNNQFIGKEEFQAQIGLWDADAGSTDFEMWDGYGVGSEQDGRLSKAEFRKNYNLFDDWDTSQNKELEESEFEYGVFGVWDYDNDGIIEPDEFELYAAWW